MSLNSFTASAKPERSFIESAKSFNYLANMVSTIEVITNNTAITVVHLASIASIVLALLLPKNVSE